MDNKYKDLTAAEAVAGLLARDLAPIGVITQERRLSGIALLEDGVMFGYVDADGTPFLRTTLATAQRFHALGSRKHPEMRYWSIPHSIASDNSQLLEAAYESADAAHLAFSFNVDDVDVIVTTRSRPLRSLVTFTLLAA